MNILDCDHRRCLGVQYFTASTPCLCTGQWIIVRVLGHAPVNIAACSDISVKFVHNLLRTIPAIRIQALSPLLVKRNIDSGIPVDTEDRIIEYPECLGILLHIMRRVHIFDIVPFLSGIDFISNDPIHDFTMPDARIAVCQE